MNRGIALLLALAAGAAAGLAAASIAFVLTWGVFWLYLFGDDPWPEWTDLVPDLLFGLVAVAVGAVVAWMLWVRLTRR